MRKWPSTKWRQVSKKEFVLCGATPSVCLERFFVFILVLFSFALMLLLCHLTFERFRRSLFLSSLYSAHHACTVLAQYIDIHEYMYTFQFILVLAHTWRIHSFGRQHHFFFLLPPTLRVCFIIFLLLYFVNIYCFIMEKIHKNSLCL